MRVALFVIIALLAFYIGYKVAEYKKLKQQVKSNIQPIIDELKIELSAIQDSVTSNMSEEQLKVISDRKDKIIELLGSFYGLSKDELSKNLK